MKNPQPIQAELPSVWRRGVAIALAIDAGVLAVLNIMSLAERPGRLEVIAHPVRHLGGTFWQLVLLALALVSAFVFSKRAGRIGWGIASLLATGLLMTFFQVYTRSTSQFVVFGGAVALGWVAGLLFARITGANARSDAYGATGALAVFAAIYVRAALHKLELTGFGWLDPRGIQDTILGHYAVDADSVTRFFQDLLLSAPVLCGVLAAFVFLMQISAPAILINRRARLVLCGMLTVFHLAVFAVTPILFQTALFLTLLFGLPGEIWARRSRSSEPFSTEGETTTQGGLVAGAASLCALALLAWLIPWHALTPRPGVEAHARLLKQPQVAGYQVSEVTELSGPMKDRYTVYLKAETTAADAKSSLTRLLVLSGDQVAYTECSPYRRMLRGYQVCLARNSPGQDPKALEALVELMAPKP